MRVLVGPHTCQIDENGLRVDAPDVLSCVGHVFPANLVKAIGGNTGSVAGIAEGNGTKVTLQIADSQNRNFPITRPLGIFSKLDAIRPIDTTVDGKVSSADPFFKASRLKICTSLTHYLDEFGLQLRLYVSTTPWSFSGMMAITSSVSARMGPL